MAVEKLDIYVEDYGSAGNHIRSIVFNIFDDVPLSTHVVPHGAPLWQFKFNWSSLTMVTFRYSSDMSNFILPVLRKTINLVELTIDDGRPDYPDTEGGSWVLLPHLEHLFINRLAFFTILETPLQRLTIKFGLYEPSLDNASVIVPFLHRSGIELLTLVIKHGPTAIVKEIPQFTPQVDKLVQSKCIVGIFDAPTRHDSPSKPSRRSKGSELKRNHYPAS